MKLLGVLAAFVLLSVVANAAQAPDSLLMTGPNFQQVPSNKIIITPDGGTQTTLGAAFSPQGLNLTGANASGANVTATGGASPLTLAQWMAQLGVPFQASSVGRPFSADGQYDSTATVSCSNGSPAFTIVGVTLPSNLTGMLMTVGHCGGGGAAVSGTVLSAAGTAVTLSVNAATTLNSDAAYVTFGHDDTANMQALLDAGVGGNVALAPGTYMMSAVATLASHTHLYCAPGATLLMLNGFSGSTANHYLLANQNFSAVTLTDDDISVDGCTFEGGAFVPSTGADGVRYAFATNVKVTNSRFYDLGDATAFVGSQWTYNGGNRAYNITNTCWDQWYGEQYVTIDHNYCETNKHGVQVTGTNTGQTLNLITKYVAINDQDIVMLNNSGAGIWLNSGMIGAGISGDQFVTVKGGHVTGTQATSATCIKVSGAGTTDVQVLGLNCDNATPYVGPADVFNDNSNKPTGVRLIGLSVDNIANSGSYGVKIAGIDSGITGSRISGTYQYAIDCTAATGGIIYGNSLIAGTGARINCTGSTTTVAVDTSDVNGRWSFMTPAAVGQTTATVSGCSATSPTGNGTTGTYTSGTTGTCAAVITINGASGMTAPNGWNCTAADWTTPADIQTQTATTTTTATISGTTVSGDVIHFACHLY